MRSAFGDVLLGAEDWSCCCVSRLPVGAVDDGEVLLMGEGEREKVNEGALMDEMGLAGGGLEVMVGGRV